MFYVTAPHRPLRTISLIYGLLVFMWLSPEDSAVWLVALLGITFASLSLAWFVKQRLGDRGVAAAYVPLGAALLAGIAGLGGAFASATLMFFKNALHAHAFWDFPPAMLVAMVARAPSWAIAGGLAGAGIGLLWLWWHTTAARNNHH